MTCPCPVPFACVYAWAWSISHHVKAPWRYCEARLAVVSGWSLCGEFVSRPVMLRSRLRWWWLRDVCVHVRVAVGTALLPSPYQWVRWGLTWCPLAFLRVSVTPSPASGPSAGGLAVKRAAECALYCRLKCSVGGSGRASDPTTSPAGWLEGWGLSSWDWLYMAGWSLFVPWWSFPSGGTSLCIWTVWHLAGSKFYFLINSFNEHFVAWIRSLIELRELLWNILWFRDWTTKL